MEVVSDHYFQVCVCVCVCVSTRMNTGMNVVKHDMTKVITVISTGSSDPLARLISLNLSSTIDDSSFTCGRGTV